MRARIIIMSQSIHGWQEHTQSRPEQPGLEHFALRVGSRVDFESLLQQFHTMNIEITSTSNDKMSNDSIFVHDPDRIKMQIYY